MRGAGTPLLPAQRITRTVPSDTCQDERGDEAASSGFAIYPARERRSFRSGCARSFLEVDPADDNALWSTSLDGRSHSSDDC